MANDGQTRFRQLRNSIEEFLHERDLDRHCGENVPAYRRYAHFWLLVGKSFVRNRCPLRASALAYATLLALVPLLAIAISVSTTLLQKEGEKPIRELIDQLASHIAPALNLKADEADTAQRDVVVARITEFVKNIQGGTLGLSGMVALVFVAIGMLRTIEATFNDIWGVSRGRGFVASFIQYWATITIGPLLLIVAFGLTTGQYFQATAGVLNDWPVLGSLFYWILPFIVLSIAFSLFYHLMPNTEVNWRAAIAGGIFGGCLFQINNILSVYYLSTVLTYSKIYGSLGVIPLLLVGLYLSWLILLFGAQVAYAFQNRQLYLQDKQAESVNQRGREFVGLRMMTRLAQAFQSGEHPLTVQQLATALDVPSRLISQLIHVFLHVHLVVEVTSPDTAYAPAKPLDQITVYDVLMALRIGQGQEVATREEPTRACVRCEFDRIIAAERTAASPITLKMLADASS